MGCGTSKADLAKYEALLQEKMELELKIDRMEADFQAAAEESTRMKTKHGEQCNLLRFKIEVLVHMLAMEEKKLEASVKRLDALKWAMLTQGVGEKTMSSIQAKSGSSARKPGDVLLASEYDLNGSFERMKKEFAASRDSILAGFADDEGRICNSMGRDEFMRKLFSLTEELTKGDVQVLSLRFYDGSAVSVSEFLEFFSSSEPLRTAKAAATAVRLSLNKLEMEQDLKGTDPAQQAVKTHEMSMLEIASGRLFNIWQIVDSPLEVTFTEISEEIDGGSILSLDIFKEILEEVCGRESQCIRDWKRAASGKQKDKADPLSTTDIDLLAERFEVGGRVDYLQFLQFFRDAGNLKAAMSCASPFRYSSDWSALKGSASMPHPPAAAKALPPQAPAPVRPSPATAAAPTPVPVPTAPKTTAAVPPPAAAVPAKAAEKAAAPAAAPTPAAVPTPVAVEPSVDPNAPISIKPDSAVLARMRVNGFGILGTYLQDPEYFEDQIKEKSRADNFHYSKESLREALQQLCAEDTEEERKDFESYLRFNTSGLVPAYDVIALLRAFRDAYERENAAVASIANLSQTDASAYVSDEERYRIDRILFYKAFAESADRITEVYHANPSSFDTVIKSAPANKKTFVGAELRDCIKSHIPDAKDSEIGQLEAELAGKKDKTGAIPSAAVCAAMRHRLAVEQEYIKRWHRAELALERVRKIIEYRERAKVDPVTLSHKTSGKKFEADVTSAAASSSVLTGNELHSILGRVVPDASQAVLDQLKAELAPKGNSAGALPIGELFACLKARVAESLRNEKLMVAEEKALAKEDAEDAVQGKGGCCGGGIYTEVYDPSKTPPEHPNIIAAREQAALANSSMLMTDDIEEKDDASFDPGTETERLHPAGQAQTAGGMRKMDSLVYTDSDSENAGHDNGQAAVRKIPRKVPAGGQSLPGMEKGGELATAHERSIGGHHVPRTLPNKKRGDSEDDVFEGMDDM